jgi:RNA polymerase sigma-70 factor (sigma-E family)
VAAPDSFEEYVAARYDVLLRTAYLLTSNRHDAEELVQTALMKAVPAWRRIESNPDAYLRRIMVNDSISRWRRRRGGEVLTEQPLDTGVHDPDASRSLALAAAMAQLAPRQRAVIVLRYYEDLTERETAEVLGTAVGTVKSQARDALARLRVLVPDLRLETDDPAEVGTMGP